MTRWILSLSIVLEFIYATIFSPHSSSLIVCIIPGCSRKKCTLVRIQNVGIEYLFIEVRSIKDSIYGKGKE